MRTIFITSFHPLISRNILQTNLLASLVARNNRIVILAPDFKKDYFQKNFGGRNIFIEGVSTALSKRDLLWRSLALAVSRTRTLDIKKRSDFYADKNFLRYFFTTAPSYIFKGRLFLNFFHALDYLTVRPKTFSNLFKKYHPDLVFATDVQNEIDVRLLQEARKSGLKTLAMTRSWDNITAKGIIRFIPDVLIVQNDIIKSEAVKYSYVSVEKIKVIGIPHYDRYYLAKKTLDAARLWPAILTDQLLKSRQDFFHDHGFNVSKPLVLLAPAGNRYIRHNKTDRAVLESLSGLDINILVRIPPGDHVDFNGFVSSRATVAFDNAGVSSWQGGRKLNELGQADDYRLIHELYWSDVVVAHLASMCIDAAFFDKPMVVIGFDPESRPYWNSIKRYFDYDHLQPIIQSGGIKIAGNTAELQDLVNQYLANPQLDRQGRSRIVKYEVEFSDGYATQRLVEELASAL